MDHQQTQNTATVLVQNHSATLNSSCRQSVSQLEMELEIVEGKIPVLDM